MRFLFNEPNIDMCIDIQHNNTYSNDLVTIPEATHAELTFFLL